MTFPFVLAPREPTEEMMLAVWKQTAKVTVEERMAHELGDSKTAFLSKMRRRYRAANAS